MDYTKRTVRCSSVGISRDQARNSLENSDKFVTGSEILSLTKSGSKWVAVLLQPKTAEFPPPKDDDTDSESKPPQFEDVDSGPEDDSPEKDEGDSEGPESDEKPSDSGDKPKSEKAELGELVSLIHQIADHLGLGADPAAPGAEDGPMPGPDGPPLPPPPGAPDGPPHGGPGGAGDPQIVLHKTKLKPGDVGPGQLPIGAPAFSSTQEAPLHRMASFDAFDDDAQKSIKQAKAELEEMYGPHGFKVRQIKRVEGGTRIAAKLSRR